MYVGVVVFSTGQPTPYYRSLGLANLFLSKRASRAGGIIDSLDCTVPT